MDGTSARSGLQSLILACVLPALPQIPQSRDSQESTQDALGCVADSGTCFSPSRPQNAAETRSEAPEDEGDRKGQSDKSPPRCEVCGGETAVSLTGRQARFCSPGCRQKAFRIRAATAAGGGPSGGNRLPSAATSHTTDLIQEVKSGSRRVTKLGDHGTEELTSTDSIVAEAKRWEGRKTRSLAILEALRTVDPDRSTKLKACGTWMAIRHWIEHQRSSMYAANFCQQPRLCQACAHVRGMKLAMSYADKAAVLLAENPDLRPWLVTFTVKTGLDLAERFDHLQRSISAMWERVRNARKKFRRSTQFEVMQGLVVSAEIKRSKAADRFWQPHCHALALVDRRDWCGTIVAGQGVVLDHLPHQQICDEWQEITGDSYVLNAKPLTSSIGAETIDRGALLCDLLEVFKYMTKPGELEPSDVIEVWQLLSGRRAVRAFGLLYGVEIPEGFDGERLSGDAWETWHRWESGRYVADRTKFVGSAELP